MDLYHSSCELALTSGATLKSYSLSYETYGQLSDKKDNAVLVCHALTGSAQAGNGGWWDGMIGPGKPLDTDHFFVICTTALGSCKGSTGPHSINPETGQPYGVTFPVITIEDMVNAQHCLLKELFGLSQLYAVIGGSMGGMQALQWSISYPDWVQSCIAIATTSQLSPQALAFSAVGRSAIFSDPDWKEGGYAETHPNKGLGIARMIGHITYLSEHAMKEKFGRKLQEKEDYGYNFKTDFQIESYLTYQGDKFISQFDANSYLYLSRAMTYFDLEKTYGSLEKAFSQAKSRYLILSIDSDWLYPSKQGRTIARSLMKLSRDVTYVDVQSQYGHDSFLIDYDRFNPIIHAFMSPGELI